MQPPFQQSAASAHIDDLMRAARSYRLAGVDRPHHGRAAARGLQGVRAAFAARPRGRAAFAARPRVRKPQTRVIAPDLRD